MRESSCCLGTGIFHGIRPHVHSNIRNLQCQISASAFVIYAVAPTIVLPQMSQRLWIRHPKALCFRHQVDLPTC